MDVSIEANPQFFGGCRQGHEGVPGAHAVLGARAKANISFADTLPDGQFGRVVMQREFGVLQHQQQRGFLGSKSWQCACPGRRSRFGS